MFGLSLPEIVVVAVLAIVLGRGLRPIRSGRQPWYKRSRG
jgi:hypothetical protein